MKKKGKVLSAVLASCLMLTGCREDPELTRFKNDFENFCVNVSTLDTSINNIDADSDTATDELLDYINQMEDEFENLAAIDFPEEFDYLEELADQASEYMTEAASSYQKAFSGEYQENLGDYAYKNYKRAYKRIQIILIYLHGEEPQDEDLLSE